MVLDFKVERLFVEKQVTFLFLPFSAVRSDGTTSPPQRKNQDKNKPCNPHDPEKRTAPPKKTHNLIASIAKASA